jgi:hypothetical protein
MNGAISRPAWLPNRCHAERSGESAFLSLGNSLRNVFALPVIYSFFESRVCLRPAESQGAQPKTLIAGYNERLNVCVRIT